MNDKMWCVIASEDPGNAFSYNIYKCYKRGHFFLTTVLMPYPLAD